MLDAVLNCLGRNLARNNGQWINVRDDALDASILIKGAPCLTKLSSSNLDERKIVPSVSYDCHHLMRGVLIKHAVGKSYALDVYMHPFMIIMVTQLRRNVPFVEMSVATRL